MTETEKLRETRGPASWRTSPRKVWGLARERSVGADEEKGGMGGWI